MRVDLSTEAKQTFQVVAVLATVMVIGIHYKSDIPDNPSVVSASWNKLAQEFIFGGLARVAVPLFAFSSGLFYFRSFDRSLSNYRDKTIQRAWTIALPYAIIATLATSVWLMPKCVGWLLREGSWPADLNAVELLSTWWLHPPAEQLWYLRDLMVLVLIAPLIGYAVATPKRCGIYLALVFILWLGNWQLSPIVAGWYVVSLETLLFFSLGAAAAVAVRTNWIEAIGRWSNRRLGVALAVWWTLVALRVVIRPDFDIWYASDYGPVDLILHQTSILVGGCAMFGFAWRLRCEGFVALSGASFFVYLVHEFPLRAVVVKIAEKTIGATYSCWIVFPLVTIGLYAAAFLMARSCPTAYSVMTGGRVPQRPTTRLRQADRPPAVALGKGSHL